MDGNITHAADRSTVLLYVMSAPSYGRHDMVKIGVSVDPRQRLHGCRSTYDHLLEIVAIFRGPDPHKAEAAIKDRFRPHRRKGTEFFATDLKEVMRFVRSLGMEQLH